MDEMDHNMVLEVPDTPDRLTLRHLVDGSSKPSWEKEHVGGVDQYPTKQNLGPTRSTYVHPWRDSNHDDLTSTSASSDTDYLFRQARLARLMHGPVENNPSLPSQSKQSDVGKNRFSNDSGNDVGKNGVSSDSGKRRETIDLNRESTFPLSYPTRCRDSRKKIMRDHEGKESGGSSGLLGVRSSTRSVARTWSGRGSKPSFGNWNEDKEDKLDRNNVELNSRDRGKRIDLGNSPINISTSSICSGVSYQYVSKSVDGGTYSSSGGVSDLDNGNQIDLCRDLESKTGLTPRRRNTGQRRLVRNGCISPCNVEKGKNIVKVKEDEVGNVLFSELPNGNASRQIHILSPDSDGSCADKRKGKVIVNDTVVANGQQVREKSQSGRVCSMKGKDLTVIADMDSDTDRFEDIDRRTTHYHKRKSATSVSCEIASVSTLDLPSNRRYESAMGNESSFTVHANPELTSSHHGSTIIPIEESPELESRSMKGKRKCSSSRSHIGESSSSTFDDSKISYLRSSRQPSNSRSIRSRRSHHGGTTLDSVIEVDELHSPEAEQSNPPEQFSRASQVESDEILARQLQEQLYNETTGLGGTEEIDASIAWSLLQEEDGRRASAERQHQSYRRGTLVLPARLRSRHSSAQTAVRSQLLTSNRMAMWRRNFSRPIMDLEMRLNVLEALELAFDGNDGAIPNNVLGVQRDFNENDYEMLLALDDNNHQHVGASENQINYLPLSVIQNDNSEEVCAVCLESPSVGDTIRHLPCLHKFHKECIDTWLRRRMCCPICKSGIT